MKRIFISDLHLDANRKDLTRAFTQFLSEQCQTINELYILGDFFELWLGDDDQSPLNNEVIEALSSLPCDVFIMHGNRDFLIGKAFCNAAGAKLLPDPYPIILGDQPALLMHGDSLCTRDEEYMKARTLLRSDAFRQDFLSKQMQERKIIAEQIRGKSQKVSREKAEDIMDVTPAEVTKVMNQAKTSILVHGHTHRPAVHEVDLQFGPGTRYVLGDWHTSTQFLRAAGSDLELVKYVF
ncbi:MAG: UDP-2,3-diacylglucosamine diphosphatase [Pseudomonadales bacterium]|nr:UDP-2,3-diacylglucosamine diphosphatase [Pseudomonadales bacterium]